MSTTTAYRRIEIHEVGDVTVVRFLDSKIIEDINIQEIGAELFALVETEQRKKILINFAGVDFFNSCALGKCMELATKAAYHGVILKMSNIRPEILEVFLITRLIPCAREPIQLPRPGVTEEEARRENVRFAYYEKEEDALAAF